MQQQQLDKLRARLLDMLEAVRQLQSDGKHSSDVVELDQTRTGRLSRMDALQLQAMAKAGQARAQLELRRIENALKRIESGEYGYCFDCGNEIASARLEANPVVTLCVPCATAREDN